MSNREIERRSERLLRIAAAPALLAEPTGCLFYPIDPEALELADLLRKEEELAALIADDQQVDLETIDQILDVARRLGKISYPTQLIDPDELYDIARTFAYLPPHAARLNLQLLMERTEDALGHRPTTKEEYDYRADDTTKPDPLTALLILAKIYSTFKPKENPAWTARVAAALAYFSNLPGPSS